MTRVRQIVTYVILAALLSGFALMLFGTLVGDCFAVITTGRGIAEYITVAVSENGQVYALGSDRGEYIMIRGDQNGVRESRWVLKGDLTPDNSRVTMLFPDTQNAFYLGLYGLDEYGEAQDLQIYRVTDKGRGWELLLREECAGLSTPERMQSVRVSSLSKADGVVSFAVLKNGEAQTYKHSAAQNGLYLGKSFKAENAQTALVLSDGRLAVGKLDTIEISGSDIKQPYSGAVIALMRQSGAGLYFLDSAGLTVNYSDLTALGTTQGVFSIEKTDYSLNGLHDYALTPVGGAVLLLDGGSLIFDKGSAVTDISAMLYRTNWQCVLILVGLGIAVLIAALILWYVVCIWRGMHLPLFLRWGALLVAVGVLCVAAVLRLNLLPGERETASSRARELTAGIVALALDDTKVSDPGFATRLSGAVCAAGEHWHDTSVQIYYKDENNAWRMHSGTERTPPGVRAELCPGFDGDLAFRAQQEGSSFGKLEIRGETRYSYNLFVDGMLISVGVNGAVLLQTTQEGYGAVTEAVWSAAAILLALSVAILVWITICLRRIISGMESVTRGLRGVKIRMRTGDELEGIANSVTGLSNAFVAVENRQRELAGAYMRFVPERILRLLGKRSVAEVDKQTFATRKMTAMTVWFSFPQESYSASVRELFDNLNEIIERTASIVSGKGGTVFDFAYDGYDAVFEGSPELAISTAVAVQQEILAFNREREIDGRMQVTLRIGIDEGNMMIGVVGDGTQLEPTAISSSFTIARHLTQQCNKLDANILCTEAVASATDGYGSRYMGKSAGGGAVIRVYEIYDGDPYRTRQIKEQTASRFSEGVYALYSRDFSAAKRVFLDLVHSNAKDGGARYYLYLADELEKNPGREISLD